MSGEARKNLKSVVCAGIVTLALAGGVREARAESHQNYFPLNVGNSWTYVDCNDGSTKTFTIIGTEEINGHRYYKFDDYVRVCGFPGCDPETCVPEDTDMLFRYEPNTDKVLQYCSSIDEDLVRYDFSGNRWPDGYGSQLIETGVSCTVPAGQFDNCCIFEFAMTVDCGEFFETLAPGVGNVRFTEFCEHFDLQSYTIVPYCGDANHPYPVGDLNHDCCVNLLDLAILASHWLERVNLEPVVYITNPPDGLEFDEAIESVFIAANAWDVDGSVVKVEFFANGSKIGEDNDGTNGWKMVTSFNVGTYILTAKATDNDGATTTSPPVTITAVEGPDLTVSESDITFSNPNPASGEEVTMTVTVHNIGGVDAGEFVVYISLSCSLDGIIWTIPMPWDWITVPHLPARSSTTISKENVSFLGGMSGIMVDVDWGNQIDESNEQNNWTGKVIEIQP